MAPFGIRSTGFGDEMPPARAAGRRGSGHGLANAPSLGDATLKSISSVVDASFPSRRDVTLRAIGKPSRV